MPRIPKVDKLMQATSAIRGLTKHFPKEGKLGVGGKAMSRAGVIALFQAHLDAMQEVDRARAALRTSVTKERALAKRAKATRVLLKDCLRSRFGTDLEVWGDFGLKLSKKPGPKTVAAKLAGVRKREAARAAR